MMRRLGIAVVCTLGLVASIRAVAAETTPVKAENTATALFAGGCFWCIEADFEKLPGVIGAESGYTAGTKPNPTYEQVSAGGTGHTEAVRVTYEPGKVSYAQLVDFFWKHIDPTVKDRQFCDVGSQYRTAIYYHNAEQKRLAEASKKALEESKRFRGPIYTEVTAAATFYPAEEYHQKYYQKNPVRYKLYRFNCGRDQGLRELWGQP